MKIRIYIINEFFILIFISFFQKVYSNINQFNTTELEYHKKLLNHCEEINKDIKKYEKRMEKIKFNLKLKGKYRQIKKLNKELLKNVKIIKKRINETEFDKIQISQEINIISNDYFLLKKKFNRFDTKYKSYEKFKSNIIGYIKLFFICFFSVVLILLVILIIVGIYMYKKRPKYHTLHEEVTIKPEIKIITNRNVDFFDKSEKSEKRNFNPGQFENSKK